MNFFLFVFLRVDVDIAVTRKSQLCGREKKKAQEKSLSHGIPEVKHMALKEVWVS